MEFCLICEQSVISVRTSSLTAAITSRQLGVSAARREAMAAGGKGRVAEGYGGWR